jgi:hypothetical protein
MEQLVTTQFGANKWQAATKHAGLDTAKLDFYSDVPDADVHKLTRSIAETAGISLDQVIEAFGDYWSSVYAPSIYSVYFDKAKSSRELLLNLDHIHTNMTKTVKGAAPPHFKYEWENDKVLVMDYDSKRGMVAFMPALIRGVAKYYKEKVSVTLKGNRLRVQFT